MPVHPHACGENCSELPEFADQLAVHPHACGENAQGRDRALSSGRFTPTRVGKTLPEIAGNRSSYSNQLDPFKIYH